MAHIEKLAADCMRDVEEEEGEEGLEEDADLLVCLPGWCRERELLREIGVYPSLSLPRPVLVTLQ